MAFVLVDEHTYSGQIDDDVVTVRRLLQCTSNVLKPSLLRWLYWEKVIGGGNYRLKNDTAELWSAIKVSVLLSLSLLLDSSLRRRLKESHIAEGKASVHAERRKRLSDLLDLMKELSIEVCSNANCYWRGDHGKFLYSSCQKRPTSSRTRTSLLGRYGQNATRS